LSNKAEPAEELLALKLVVGWVTLLVSELVVGWVTLLAWELVVG
jgi:hypothetical protein